MLTGAAMKLVVLISGRGSNLRALREASRAGRLKAAIAAVISESKEAPGLAYARDQGLPTLVLPAGKERDPALAAALEEHCPDWILAAGYMRILPASLVSRWRGRMLNIHPSLLPLYPGLDTHARVLRDGASRHGASVHFIDETLDGGPLIAQAPLEVCGDDEAGLAARVLRLEHLLYPLALHWCVEGLVECRQGRACWRALPRIEESPEEAAVGIKARKQKGRRWIEVNFAPSRIEEPPEESAVGIKAREQKGRRCIEDNYAPSMH